MERPSEWISNDPDFRRCQEAERFKAFLSNQRERDYPAGLGAGESSHSAVLSESADPGRVRARAY
jgi:hypothetical protein